jgi:hypothetical protein
MIFLNLFLIVFAFQVLSGWRIWPTSWSYNVDQIATELTNKRVIPSRCLYPMLRCIRPGVISTVLREISCARGTWISVSPLRFSITAIRLRLYHMQVLPFKHEIVLRLLHWFPRTKAAELVNFWETSKPRIVPNIKYYVPLILPSSPNESEDVFPQLSQKYQVNECTLVGVWCMHPALIGPVTEMCKQIAGPRVNLKISAHLCDVKDEPDGYVAFIGDVDIAVLEWHEIEATNISLPVYLHLLMSPIRPRGNPASDTAACVTLLTPACNRPLIILCDDIGPCTEASIFDKTLNQLARFLSGAVGVSYTIKRLPKPPQTFSKHIRHTALRAIHRSTTLHNQSMTTASVCCAIATAKEDRDLKEKKL